MPDPLGPSIRVHHTRDDWHSMVLGLEDLEDVHWLQPAGAPQPLLHGFVRCRTGLAGTLPHSCEGDTVAHRVRVCVLKRHATAAAWEELARRALPSWSAAGGRMS